MSRRPASARPPSLFAGAVITSLLLAGCSSPAEPSGGSEPGSDPSDAAAASEESLQRYYDQEISFGGCVEFATTDTEAEEFASEAFECGRLEVPLDYDDPDGRTAQIAVLRAPASGDRQGSLVVNPGGPGRTGTDFARLVWTSAQQNPVTRQFDVVGFDPRGTGASTPALDCFDEDERNDDAVVIPFIAGGERYTEGGTQDLAEQCAERSGGEDVLANAGTRDVARDLDVLREALGDDQLTYLGDSWGTRLGAVYAETFPDKVRAMILDGALDPTTTWSARALTQFEAFQASFEAVAQFCASGPDCPLGDDPDDATQRFQQMVRPLVEDPVPAGQEPDASPGDPERVLSARAALDGVISGLYAEDLWPAIVDGLRELEAGRGDQLLRLRDFFHQRSFVDGRYNNFLESTTAVYCADEERLSPEEATRMRAAILEAAPFMDLGEPVETRDGCEDWPAEPTLGFPYADDVEGLPELMVVSITGDPATPYEDGVGLAETLDATLLTVNGNVHGATFIQQNDCVDDYAADYLIDLTAPPADAECDL